VRDRLTVGEILGDDDAWRVAPGCAEETIAVAKASNITLNVCDPIEHIRKLGARFPTHGVDAAGL